MKEDQTGERVDERQRSGQLRERERKGEGKGGKGAERGSQKLSCKVLDVGHPLLPMGWEWENGEGHTSYARERG